MKKHLKIFFVIDSLGEGGSERSLAELLPYLREHNVNSTIICLSRRELGVHKDVEREQFEVRILRGTGWIQRIRELRQIIQATKPDIVHTTLFKADIVGRLASIGLPVIVLSSLVNTTYHSTRFEDKKVKPIKLRIVRWIDRLTSKFCTSHFHAVSRTAKTAAMEDLKIGENRITIVERGRDPQRLGQCSQSRRKEARRALQLTDEAKVLLNVGRHEFQKGHRYLIEAMSYLHQKNSQLVLLIAGREGNTTQELMTQVKESGLNDQIRFLGHREDIPDLLASADLFVFPSLFEGLPGAVIEAMALGLPVIASDIPSLREVVENGKNALLVPAASPKELAAAIDELLKDPGRMNRFSEKSREIFEQRFTLERYAERMLHLYHDVASMAR